MKIVMNQKNKLLVSLIIGIAILLCACRISADPGKEGETEGHIASETARTEAEEVSATRSDEKTTEVAAEELSTEAGTEEPVPEITMVGEVMEDRVIHWDPGWKYADYSRIHGSDVTIYYSRNTERKNKVVAVNAGHGTGGGESERTLSHPDGSGKVTGGTNGEGEKYSMAISEGMEFDDGTAEASATLSLAILLKEELLDQGFDVLMIREDTDTRLDNIARTVYANNNADYHIALHYDGTGSDKGAFYISVPDVASYREMEPVASHWKEHNALGEALIRGIKEEGIHVFGSGSMEMDLTQTSYSTIPSVDLEVGDTASDHSETTQRRIARGIVRGLISFTQ